MKIGKFSKVSGLTVETLRYYERIGLLGNPDRTPSGYRQYTAQNLDRVKFIKHAQDLGFRLHEIKALLNKNIDTILSKKIAALEEKLEALTRAKAELEALID